MYKSLAMAGVLLASPLIVNAQSTVSFETCSDAISNLDRFTQIGVDQTNAQLLNSDLTQAQHDLRIAELGDMQNTFTMDACMQGEYEQVFQCLTIQKGNLTDCRQ